MTEIATKEPVDALTVPTEVVAALCKLNAHARAYGCGKRAIYAYKTLVAAILAASGTVSTRLVRWAGKCGKCDGTGRFTLWEGGTAPCRGCSAKGETILKFVETTFPDGSVWHHPFDYFADGGEIADVANLTWWDGQKGRWTTRGGDEPIFWNIGNDWHPRQKGERLNVDAAATALNTVEAWVLTKAFPHRHYELDERPPITNKLHWMVSRAERELRSYWLDLGRVGEQCWYCGHHDIRVGLHREGPPFSWAAPVCKKHSDAKTEQWPASADVPKSAVTPSLEEWRERHERIGFLRNERDYWD